MKIKLTNPNDSVVIEKSNGTSSDVATKADISALIVGDDAARANWGGDWRMPTNAEFQTLGNIVYSVWTDDYLGTGVAGRVCTDVTNNSKVLFFPAGGSCYSGSVNLGNSGRYWSSSLNTDSRQNAFLLDFGSGGAYWDSSNSRYFGYAVRPVLDGTNANGHEYVEIGGIKWATMNIGASSITDYGLYFQWGDTQGYTVSQVGSGAGQKYFGWADYKYGNGTSSPSATDMTKYNATDGLTTLEYLRKVAVTGNYNDLSNKPTIPAAVAVKGNAESSYRTGNVNITPANIGLGNVGNFKAVSTVANQGLTNSEKENARTNIGAGTSSFSGSYNDLTNKPVIPTIPASLPANGGNADTVDGYHYNNLPYLSSSGGTLNGTLTVNAGNCKFGPGLNDNTYKYHHALYLGDHGDNYMKFYENEFQFWANGGNSKPIVKIGADTVIDTGNISSYIPSSLPASDVYSWAKASSKPSYSFSELSGTSDVVEKDSNGDIDVNGVCGLSYIQIGDYSITRNNGILEDDGCIIWNDWLQNTSVEAISSNTQADLSSLAHSYGASLTCIYRNSGSSDVTVTVPTTYDNKTIRTPDGSQLNITIPAGGYGEINFIYEGSIIYARGL